MAKNKAHFLFFTVFYPQIFLIKQLKFTIIYRLLGTFWINQREKFII